jgi:nucleotide-binding universal stress UspA family protein
MKLLLAVDGSDHTKRMLAWLAEHNDVFGSNAELSALTVVPPLPAHVTRHLDRALVDAYYAERAAEVLDPVAAFGREHGWRLETRSLVGRPADSIAEAAAKSGCDMLLLGSHGHSPTTSLLLGSVAQRVLATSRLPTLIVH